MDLASTALQRGVFTRFTLLVISMLCLISLITACLFQTLEGTIAVLSWHMSLTAHLWVYRKRFGFGRWVGALGQQIDANGHGVEAHCRFTKYLSW